MVTVQSTAITTTFQKGITAPVTSPFDTTSASYVDVTGLSIASVPNNSKIYFSLYIDKLTAGTMDVRVTDGTNVFWEETGIPPSNVEFHGSLDGSVIQNSGGVATVKVQILSSDGNTARLSNSISGSSWLVCTDMTGADPIVVAPTSTSAMTDAPFVFSGKRQIDELYVSHPSRQVDGGDDDEFSVNVMGYNVDPLDQDDATPLTEFMVEPSVITSEIGVYPGHSAPIWAATINRGRGAVIISWTGYNIEVTG